MALWTVADSLTEHSTCPTSPSTERVSTADFYLYRRLKSIQLEWEDFLVGFPLAQMTDKLFRSCLDPRFHLLLCLRVSILLTYLPPS